MASNLQIVNLLVQGAIPYKDALQLQRDLVERRQRDEISDTLLMLCHPPTITYGKTADPKHRLLTDAEYAEQNIAVVATDRGGDVTYHGPGQLVGYPIIHLGEGSRDLHRYVRGLETILIETCADLGVLGASRAPWHAGIWVGDGYLAALGIRVSRWVTHHGFALNLDDRVHTGFATIVPCGVPDKHIVTLSALLNRTVTLEETADAVAKRFTTDTADCRLLDIV